MYESLYQNAKDPESALRRLMDIISLLRSEEGCPWDREQDHHSLRVCLLEEAYEAADAIDREDWDNLEEELGDLLLQVVFHAELAETEGVFDMRSLVERESEKMIRRHPHVFLANTEKNGEQRAESVDKALEKWENVKQKERKGSRSDRMDSIPRALPALTRSYKIQAKAAEVGFDWDSVDGAFQKVAEEREELMECCQSPDRAHVLEEVGDLLFAVVNVARFLDIDPEEALDFTSRKFIRRFRSIEEMASAQGRRLEDMGLAEMDGLWERAKAAENCSK